MGDVKKQVEDKIAKNKVMVFAKSSCPHSKKAKAALRKYIGVAGGVPEADVEFWDIENEANMDAIQAVLKEMTGASSVPRVFINGKFIGGGSETVDLDKSGELKTLLKA